MINISFITLLIFSNSFLNYIKTYKSIFLSFIIQSLQNENVITFFFFFLFDGFILSAQVTDTSTKPLDFSLAYKSQSIATRVESEL